MPARLTPVTLNTYLPRGSGLAYGFGERQEWRNITFLLRTSSHSKEEACRPVKRKNAVLRLIFASVILVCDGGVQASAARAVSRACPGAADPAQGLIAFP